MSDTKKEPLYPVIGKLALKRSLLKKRDIEKAIAACAGTTSPDKDFEDYLVSRKLISSLDMKRLNIAAKAIIMRQRDIKFGTIAVNMKIVTRNLIEMALDEQKKEITEKKRARRVGDILVEAGIISSLERDLILKEQHRLQKETNRAMQQADMLMEDKTPLEDIKRPGDKISDGPEIKSDQPEPGKKDIDIQQGRTKIFPEGIKLVISGDGLAAYLSKTKKFDNNIKPDDILELLETEHISFGIVDRTLIKGFIESKVFLKKPFKVAAGIAPFPGKNGKIKYFFDTDRLKPGKINQDGGIDFKERGEIPYVKEGTLLAEKIPMVKEKSGKSVFGDVITIQPAVDAKLKYDKGAKFSENSTKIVSSINGQPTLSWSGVISVLDDFVTRADVNYETGHINYKGNIRIKGCVQNKFKVRGNNIWANEIDGGIIHAERDLRVAGVIRNARIYSRGNVWAKFIQKSEILCMGDVHSTKEIVESRIENSGACILEKGKIISSHITSKMGVYARDIGTDISKPSHITIGIDVFIPKEIEKLRKEISAQEIKIAGFREKITILEQDNRENQDKITKLAQIQDRAELEQKGIAGKISSRNQSVEIEEIGKLQNRLNDLKKIARNAEKELDACFNRIDIQDKKITRLNVSIALQKDKVKDLVTEKKNLIEWGKNFSGVAMVKVTGTIMAGTMVVGKHSEKRIGRKIKNATIKEVVVAPPKAEKKESVCWEMCVIPG